MHAGLSCAQCDHDITSREVVLLLDAGVKLKFCSDRCERRWLVESSIRWRRFLRRIFTLCRGRSAELARAALYTDTPP